ncbi:protein of unknown function [Pseudarthrobacter equi]|uniref:DUF222 domain-containing protein n=1 Tax=Pseudarthrobacter equi TaxID=728066 RepID=A0A1H1UP52_9MICC|nr:HNH endonuclease signature motif containing protein [Pseudarthrobacter equi]SDS74318.1 protein of unknown function [Pseudarthrobacter equi]
MEAIGEQVSESGDSSGLLPLGRSSSRPSATPDDGPNLRTAGHLRPVPGSPAPDHASEQPLDLPLDVSALTARVAAAAVTAREALPTTGYTSAATFAADVEELSRCVEYLQLIAAGAVDHTRTHAITDAATRAATHRTARRTTAGVSSWDANGTETLNETDTNWPTPAGAPTVVRSPADDGCRNTAEFLRLRLRIPIREARRRLTLAQQTLPGTTLTGTPTPPPHEHLATTLAPSDASTGQPATPATPPHTITAPAVSSQAATIITATLDRLQHHTTPEILHGIEHHLTHAATTADPDFLTRLAQRLTETIDADGTEPTEEALRHTQGAFIRKPRHGLHHVEIFATTDQYEHLLTAMNIATNPRTTTPNTTTNRAATDADDGGNGDNTVLQEGARSGNQASPAPDLERRTRPQQQLDGIITAVKTALTTNHLPTTGGNRPQIIATINHHDLFPTPTPTTPHTPAAGTFAFTGPVAATTLRKIACDADIIPALLGTTSEILDLGRKTRLFTPTQRVALTARDQGCTFPNCTIPAPWCEAHHITYWSHGGHTNTTNGTSC